MVLLLLGFISAFIKGYQTQTVVSGSYHMAFIMSWLWSATTLATVLLSVENGWASLLPLGIGGSVGVVLSMYIYRNK